MWVWGLADDLIKMGDAVASFPLRNSIEEYGKHAQVEPAAYQPPFFKISSLTNRAIKANLFKVISTEEASDNNRTLQRLRSAHNIRSRFLQLQRVLLGFSKLIYVTNFRRLLCLPFAAIWHMKYYI